MKQEGLYFMQNEINYISAFQAIPAITGLPVQLSRGKWYGACYIDGSPHDRWNKTVIYLVKDGIRILEQGGDNLSLSRWLVEYGDCGDYAAAFARIRAGSGGVPLTGNARTWVEPTLKYVDAKECGSSAGECNLKLFLIDKFGLSRTAEVWSRYGVGSKILRTGDMATVFWYVDEQGRCCHDKVMLYGLDGRRNKEYGGGRKYKVGDGFRGKTYFGSHLLGAHKGKVFLVESEKSALALACNDTRGDLFLATGGASMLREVRSDWRLYSDFDTAGMCWMDRYPSQCVRWWERYSDAEKGMDIADVILREK